MAQENAKQGGAAFGFAVLGNVGLARDQSDHDKRSRIPRGVLPIFG